MKIYSILNNTVEFESDQDLNEDQIKEVEEYYLKQQKANTPVADDPPVSPAPVQNNPQQITLKPTEYDSIFKEAGEKYNINPLLLKSIAKVESDFNPNAENQKSGALGIMQIMPGTAKGLEKNYGITVDPRDATSSIYGAAALMDELLKKYNDDTDKALQDYNGGPKLVGNSTQTKTYSTKVLNYATNQSPTNVATTVPADQQKANPVPNVSKQPTAKQEEIQFNELLKNEDYFSFVEDYMEARFGLKKGGLQKGESREDYIDRFANHMRHVNYNNIDLTQELMWTANSSRNNKIKAGRAFELWDSIPIFDGGYDKFGAFKDIGQALVTDITSYLGFGVGKIASIGASKTALRLVTAQTKKLAQGKSTAKVDKLLNKVKRNTKLKAAGVGFVVEGAVGSYSGVLDQQLAVQQYRQDVVDPTAVALNGAIAGFFGGIAAIPTAKITAQADLKKFTKLIDDNKKPVLDGAENKELAEILAANDEQIKAMQIFSPDKLAGKDTIKNLSTEQNSLLTAQVSDKLMPMMVKVAIQLMKSNPEEYKRLTKGTSVFNPTTGKTEILKKDESISVSINRVLSQISDIDDDALQQATSAAGVDSKSFALFVQKQLKETLDKAGVTTKDFASAMQSTVADAGASLGVYSYASKLLGKMAKTDPELNKLIGNMNGDIDSPGVMSYLGNLIVRGERESKVLVTSALSTTTRNVMGNLGAMTFQSAAGVFESIFQSTARAGYKLLGGKNDALMNTNRGFVESIQDSFTVWGKMANYGLTSQTADKLLKFNRNISDNLYNALQVGEKGTEEISKFSRFFSSINLAQDAFFRKSMFTASVEQRMKDVGLNMYDFIAKDKPVPVDILKKASDDAMKGTFSYQFKNKGYGKGIEATAETMASQIIKGLENIPFGSLAVTFPRFVANALAYQYRYSPAGATSGMQDIYNGIKKGDRGLYAKGTKALSEGVVGSALIYAAYEYRKDNQDKPVFQIEAGEGTEFNIQPLFPIAPYLAVGDYIVKLFNGESPERIKESLEAIAGLKLPGGTQSTALSLVDEIVNQSSGKSAERVETIIGTVLGDFIGRAIQPLKPLFEFFEGMSNEPATGRNPNVLSKETLLTGEGGPVWLEILNNRIKNKIPENLTGGLYGKESLPKAVRYFDEGPPVKVGSFFTNFTGMTMTPKRTEAEKEFIKLDIDIYKFFPPSGLKFLDMAKIAASVDPIQEYVTERINRKDYESKSLSEKKLALTETVKDAISLGREAATQQMYYDPENQGLYNTRIYHRLEFHNLSKQQQKIINQKYAEDPEGGNGKTIEETKKYEDYFYYYNYIQQR